jgi:hypothetical protein
MTGSGKTGLCIALLEEAALAGIPVIAIDPKGDLANLALVFPEHSPEDFAPWVDSPATAKELSDRWRVGLAESGVDPERSRAFAEHVKVTVHTPGSTSGAPIDVLGVLAARPEGVEPAEEAWTDLVNGAVSGLLGLAGVEADPIRDPRHLVLSRILSDGWAASEVMDLERIVVRLVDPPFPKIGVFPVESFLPRPQRMELALALNAIAASPSFARWSRGIPLDVDALLDPTEGTPIRVMYLAHLDEAQRTFFLSLLLNRIVAWSRRQPGTPSLRALLYLDEVYGYLPPYPKNPPTKRPVLTLLKQARAVGLGTVLATQNPVDLDYAALANAGTWFIGRLNTPQDRKKALDGLTSATGGDSGALASTVEGLPQRSFLVRDVSTPAPWVLTARFTISFLRGPLTLREVARLRPASADPAPVPVPVPDSTTSYPPDPPPPPPGFEYRYLDPSVVFSSRLAPFFASEAIPARPDGATIWKPALHAHLHLKFDQGREFSSERDEHRLWFPLDAASLGQAVEPPFEPADFLPSPGGSGRYAPLPAFLDEARELAALAKRVVEEVLRSETDAMYELPALELQSRVGESSGAFLERAHAAVQERIDAEVGKLKTRVDAEVQRLDGQRDRLLREKERHATDVKARQTREIVSAGETLLGWFFGSRSTMTAATRALRNHQSTAAAQGRVGQAEAEMADLERKIFDLEAQTADRIREIENEQLRALEGIREMAVRLDREDVRVERFGVVWVPVTRAVA